MTFELRVRVLIGGVWVHFSLEEAQELRDFLISEPSITATKSPTKTTRK